VLQFRNETPFAGSLALTPDASGVDTVIAVVKGTFTLTARPAVAAAQVPVAPMAVYYGEAATSSMRAAPDMSLPKPATDILLVGSAHAPRHRPVEELMVEVHVGPVSRYARVSGDRFWRATGGSYTMTRPLPFAVMPLTFERAFGGREETPDGWREEPRNPVGTGYRASEGVYAFDGLPLPNVEHPDEPVTSWKDRPRPCGFGPVSPHWEPRRSYAGTYDEAWQQRRAPYLPDDFDPRFLQVAPPESIAPAPLTGGEPVVLRGLSPDGDIGLTLPSPALELTFVLDNAPHRRPATLDTLTFEPDEGRFTMVWRAAFPADKKTLRMSEVRVSLSRPP
jgi:hypothetical protein